jgi:DNA polymerase-3 subunit alpha
MLRAAGPEGAADHARLTDAPAWTHRQMLDHEKAAVGFYVSGHPLEDYAEKIGWLNCTQVSDLAAAGPNARVRVAGVISEFAVRNTKKGDRYAMFKVEDSSGLSVKCVMWPEAFRTKGQEAANDRAVVVTGRCEGAAEGSPQLVLDEVAPIEQARHSGGRFGAPNKTLVVEFEVDGDHARLCDVISQTLLAHPGDCEVVLDLLLRDEGLKVRARTGGVIRVRPNERLQDELRAAGAGVRWVN